MHTHKISNQKHIHFLREERKDPITGDLILEGDEVVFCANCKSAFMKSSWEYINKWHCNSDKTLSKFPQSKNIRIAKLLPTDYPYFIISDSFSRAKKKLTKRFGNYWKEEKRAMKLPEEATNHRKSKVNLNNFNIDKTPLQNITLIISFIVSILIYFTANLTNKEEYIVLTIAVGIFVYPFILGYFRPELFFDINKVIVGNMFYPPMLFFEKDKLCLYFENGQKQYYVDYKDISIIRLYYKGTRNMFYKIEIVTQDNYFLSFALQDYEIERKTLLKKTRIITKLIYENSKKTLITFRVEPSTQMFYSLNNIRKESKHIHLENI